MNTYIDLLIKEALLAANEDEIPVSCLIYNNSGLISLTHNTKNTNKNPLEHAEILAINEAIKKLNCQYLTDCTIIISLEPCIMCLGAILNARIGKIIYLLEDEKTGALGGLFSYLSLPNLPFYPTVIYQENDEYKNILKSFFQNKRKL